MIQDYSCVESYYVHSFQLGKRELGVSVSQEPP